MVEPLALAELRDLDPHLEWESLEPGIVRLSTELAPHVWNAQLLRRDAGLDLIFLRHIQPVDYVLRGRDDPPGLQELAHEILQLAYGYSELLTPGTRVAVHARRSPAVLGISNGQLRDALGGGLAESLGVEYEPRDPDIILSLYASRSSEVWRLNVGAALAAVHLTSWPGGRVTFRREETMVSRAQFKLLEAAQRFQLELDAGGQALDLGAAPGGWSWELARRGWQVSAVDPAPLDPRVSGLTGVRHHRTTAEDLPVVELAYDLILCDINWDPVRSASALVRVAPALRSEGRALFIVKWMDQTPSPGLLGRVFTELASGYELIRAKHLFYNRGEITVLLGPPAG